METVAKTISDTTILSSTGAGSHHIDHVMTQLPYALVVGVIASAGFIVLGFSGNILLSLLAAFVVFILAVFIIKLLVSFMNTKTQKV